MNHPAEKPTVEEIQRRMELVANYLHTVVEPGDALLKKAMQQMPDVKVRKEDMH